MATTTAAAVASAGELDRKQANGQLLHGSARSLLFAEFALGRRRALSTAQGEPEIALSGRLAALNLMESLQFSPAHLLPCCIYAPKSL